MSSNWSTHWNSSRELDELEAKDIDILSLLLSWMKTSNNYHSYFIPNFPSHRFCEPRLGPYISRESFTPELLLLLLPLLPLLTPFLPLLATQLVILCDESEEAV